MRATLAIARATVAETLRSRVAVGLVVLLGLAQAGLALTPAGDGTETGRASAFLASSLDLTWALLAVIAVFLATTSLSRELEDGRAVAIVSTPVPRLHVLLGKWLGLGFVLAFVLALGLLATGLVVELIHTRADQDQRARMEREVLVGRAVASPPRLETDAGGGVSLDALAPPEARDEAGRAIARARARLEELVRRGDLPPGMKPEDALAKILKEEVVRALSVGPGRTISWTIGPIDAVPDGHEPPPVALRYRYNTLGVLPPGKGPTGAFAITGTGFVPREKQVASRPEYFHELPSGGDILAKPRLACPADGKVTGIERVTGGSIVTIDGAPLGVPQHFTLAVKKGQDVKQGDLLASSDKVWLHVSYTNLSSAVVVFPPEGVSLLYVERTFVENLRAAYLVLLGRLLFLVAVGLACSTFLDGKVAALATFFVLGVASAHDFLDSAVGPILASRADNVFGAFDAPLKAVLRFVLFVLPDLGRYDPSDALATGQSVAGALASVGGLALLGGGVVLAAGGYVFSRRELEGKRS